MLEAGRKNKVAGHVLISFYFSPARQWLFARISVYIFSALLLYQAFRLAIPKWWRADPRISFRRPYDTPDASTVQALAHFFQRSWWTRTWIIQEISAAREATIFCGSRNLALEELYDAVEHIEDRVNLHDGKTRSPYIGTNYQRVSIFESIIDLVGMPAKVVAQRYSLLFLINQFSNSEATDPRDKVYGLLGLAQDGVSITPDYAKTTQEVYIEATQKIIQTAGNLDILRACLFSGSVSDFPSWVPDLTVKQVRSVSGQTYWRRPYSLSARGIQSTSDPEPDIITFSSVHDRLTVQGIYVASLVRTPTIFTLDGWMGSKDISAFSDIVHKILAIISQPIMWLKHVAFTPRIFRLWSRFASEEIRTYGDLIQDYAEPTASDIDYQQRRKPRYHFPRSMASYSSVMLAEGRGNMDIRRWGLDVEHAKGFPLGVDSVNTYADHAQIRDEVVFLLGAKTPFLVRRLESEVAGTGAKVDEGQNTMSNSYKLIGPMSFGGTYLDSMVWEDVKKKYGQRQYELEKIELL